MDSEAAALLYSAVFLGVPMFAGIVVIGLVVDWLARRFRPIPHRPYSSLPAAIFVPSFAMCGAGFLILLQTGSWQVAVITAAVAVVVIASGRALHRTIRRAST